MGSFNVNFGRVAMSLNKEQEYMAAFVWINPKELYILEAFPKVIMIDTTEKINNEKRLLLTDGEKIQIETCSSFLECS